MGFVIAEERTENRIEAANRNRRKAVMMKVSIIIPVYKVEKYLSQCVDSVLNQTYQDFEIILVDDGSPDACPKICDQYASSDARIIVIHKKNGGLSDARNAGIRCARGAYTMFLDADDYWIDPNALEKLTARLQKTNADVLNYSYRKVHESDGTIVDPFEGANDMPLEYDNAVLQLTYLFQNHLYICSACNKIVRTEILQNGVLFRVGDTSEDVEWCAELLTKAKSFDFVPENFYCYRQRVGSITHGIKRKNCEDLKKHIIRCAELGNSAGDEIRPFVYQFTAYQLAVFVATQSAADEYPEQCVRELEKYTWLFQYKGITRNERMIAILCKIIGYQNLCRLVRRTRKIWSRR